MAKSAPVFLLGQTIKTSSTSTSTRFLCSYQYTILTASNWGLINRYLWCTSLRTICIQLNSWTEPSSMNGQEMWRCLNTNRSLSIEPTNNIFQLESSSDLNMDDDDWPMLKGFGCNLSAPQFGDLISTHYLPIPRSPFLSRNNFDTPSNPSLFPKSLWWKAKTLKDMMPTYFALKNEHGLVFRFDTNRAMNNTASASNVHTLQQQPWLCIVNFSVNLRLWKSSTWDGLPY